MRSRSPHEDARDPGRGTALRALVRRVRGAARTTAAPLAAFATFAALSLPSPARAFVYPEHRDIGVAAIARLAPAERAELESLWASARGTFRGPMCTSVSAGEQGPAPRCVDLAALPAIAGDHSCSPRDVVENVLPSAWISNVARVAQETKMALARADSPSAVFNTSASMNLDLQRVDPDYLSRAGANSAHFLIARESNELAAYVAQSLREGAPLNALGLYLHYHVAALSLAQALANGARDAQPRAAGARDVIALETFALHWLEDSFASGHAAGTWGSDAWRKGTHDYYCERGLDMTTWSGERIVAFGDSHMKVADLARASKLVATSLRQVLSALHPGDPLATSVRGAGLSFEAAYALDSCRREKQPAPNGLDTLAVGTGLATALRDLPMPARGADDVHLARFRQEFGVFAGGFANVIGSLNGGERGTEALRPAIELAGGLRVGYAAPAIVGTFGTAKAFVETGLVMQSSQAQTCDEADGCTPLVANLLPRVPSRTGIRVGLRLPFYLVPGDLLLLGPLLLAVAPKALPSVGITAMRGGLIPYERSFRTSAGTFQIVAGREAEVTFFGYVSDSVEVRPIGKNASGEDLGGVVLSRSIRTRLPLLEWTPIRSFATNVTFAVPIQAGFGFELPTSTSVIEPAGARDAGIGVGWDVFLRLQLDVQYFFGEREDAR